MRLFDTVFKKRRAGDGTGDTSHVLTASAQPLSSSASSSGNVMVPPESRLPPSSTFATAEMQDFLSQQQPTRQTSNSPTHADDDVKSIANSVAQSRKSQKQSTKDKRASYTTYSEHKHHVEQVFLAPLQRRKMIIPDAIRERKALYDKETNSNSLSYGHYENVQHDSRLGNDGSLRKEEPLRPATPLDDVSAAPTYVPMAYVTVSAAELCAVRRLASFDEPVRKEASLPVEISTSGYKLRWLYDPIKHKRPETPSTLLTMRTDYLTEGGSEMDHYPFIDSPRSVLVLVRNGTNPMELQKRPHDVGASSPHRAFRDGLREEELKRLQAEYTALCEVLPQSTIDSFFNLLFEASHHDPKTMGPQVIKPLLERDDEGIYRVSFHYEVSTAATAVVEKLDRTRANLRNLVESEINLTQKRTETLRQQQERSLAASKKHDSQIAQRKQQRMIAAAIKSEAVKQRTALRLETSEQLRRDAEEKYLLKQERLAAAEARMMEEELRRRVERRQREEEREQRRLEALRAADEHAENVLVQRTRVVEEKDDACAAAKAIKTAQQQEAKARRQENERKALVRKQELEEIKALAREERLAKQMAREEVAEEQVERLRKEQATSAAIKNLVMLQKSIFMDERQHDEEERRALEREAMLARREEAMLRQERLLTVLDQRRKERQIEREEQRVERAIFQKRQAGKNQFASLMAADRMLEANARMDAAANARESMTKEAMYERERLLQWRQQILLETRKQAEERERAATLQMFNAEHPSDAVRFAAKNAAGVLGMSPQRKIPTKMAHRMPLEPMELL